MHINISNAGPRALDKKDFNTTVLVSSEKVTLRRTTEAVLSDAMAL